MFNLTFHTVFTWCFY